MTHGTRTRRLWSSLVALALAVVAPLFASSISGHVEAESGLPLEGILVYGYRLNAGSWEFQQYGFTGTTGNYTLDDLPAGEYRVEFYDWDYVYISQYFNHVANFADANSVIVETGSTVGNIDATLALAGHIQGVVTASSSGLPIESIYVESYRRTTDGGWVSAGYTYTDETGAYDIGGLPGGVYTVQFIDGDGNYATEWYDNQTELLSASSFQVFQGSTTPGIDAALDPAASIQGFVTVRGSGDPLSGIDVYLCRWNGSWWQWTKYTTTDSAGEYFFGGLAAGRYRVGFFNNEAYADEYYNDQAIFESALSLDLVAGQEEIGINAALELAGTIDGTVTAIDTGLPMAGVWVAAYRLIDGKAYWISSDTTDTSGQYSLEGLGAGSYRVEFGPPGGSGYLPEWYQDAHDEADAASVTVAAGAATKHIDAALDLPGQITGRIFGNGRALAGAEVWLRKAGNDQIYGQARSGADGTYVIAGVPPGRDYEVKADAPGFAARWWDAAAHRSGAQRFDMTSGQLLTDISLDLPPGAAPAYANITSDPAGADIFVDFQPMANVTPLQLELRPAASHPLILAASHASHVVSVHLAGYPWPEPREVDTAEAETIDVHFTLRGSATGAVRVVTLPTGADLFVDIGQAARGATPCVVDDLAPGEHWLFFKTSEDYLRPQPVRVFISANDTNLVTLPLTRRTVDGGLTLAVRSLPDELPVYVDGIEEQDVSDLAVKYLDPRSYSGDRWYSASHVVSVAFGRGDMSPLQSPDEGDGETLWFIDDGALTPLSPPAGTRLTVKRPRLIWSEAWGAHGYRVQLQPLFKKMAASPLASQGYIDSGLLPLGTLSWQPPEDLPDGDYKWDVCLWDGENFGPWVEGSEFSVVSFQIDEQILPEGAVGAAFSAAFSSSGGTAPVSWFARLGNVAHYVSTWTNRPFAPTYDDLDLVNIVSGNDTYTPVAPPFELPLYGQLHSTIWVDANGRVDFQEGASDYAPSLAKLLAARCAAPYWTDLYSVDGPLLTIYQNSTRLVFRWEAQQTVGRQTTPVVFQATHWLDGRIEFDYDGGGRGALVGLSAGDGVRLDLPTQSFAGACPTGMLAFVPVALPPGMSLTTDGVLQGTPTAAGTYELLIEARDAAGQLASRLFSWTVSDAGLQPPTLESTTPPPGAVELPAGADAPFHVEIVNPDGVPLHHFWTWNDVPVGTDVPDYLWSVLWTESGDSGTLRCVTTAANPPTELTAIWTVTILNDNDTDGLPNEVERDHGLNPNDDTDAAADFDLDDFRNDHEIYLDTDLNDPDSFFQIQALTRPVAGSFALRFHTGVDVPYQIQRAPQLPAAPGDWQNLGAPIIGLGGDTNVTVTPPAAPRTFFRVQALLP